MVVKRNGLDAQACGGVEELFGASAKSLLDLVNPVFTLCCVGVRLWREPSGRLGPCPR
jgi:hypothetical protein